MGRKLPPPPKQSSPVQEEQWREQLWRYVTPQISTSADAAAAIPSNSTYHGVTALSAARILTLADSAEFLDAQAPLVVQDESGAAGSHTITIQTSGSDTINGGSSVTISSNYGRRTIFKRGAGKFYSA